MCVWKLGSDTSSSIVYFVEKLDLWTSVRSVVPRLLINKFQNRSVYHTCFFDQSSNLGLLFAKLFTSRLSIGFDRLNFAAEDQRDSEGLQLRNRVLYKDLAEVLDEAVKDPLFQRVLEKDRSDSRIGSYLARSIANPWRDQLRLWGAMLLVQLAQWVVTEKIETPVKPVLFLGKRPWMSLILRYGEKFQVDIVAVYPSVSWTALLRKRIPDRLDRLLVALKYGLRNKFNQFSLKKANNQSEYPDGYEEINNLKIGNDGFTEGPKLVAHYLGQFNLHRPECHSDFHYLQTSALQGSDVIVSYSVPAFPLDYMQLKDMEKYNITPVVTHPGATTISEMEILSRPPRNSRNVDKTWSFVGRSQEAKWIREQIVDYWGIRSHWTKLFEQYNAKLFVSWYKFDGSHCAIADAMDSVGGITAMYQRAFEADPTPDRSTSVDIAFGYSKFSADIERQSRSNIRYYIVTGYIGDHRFAYWRQNAKMLRDKLRSNGAKKIIAFLDENTYDDPLWNPGHHTAQEAYGFLLQKLLDHPWLGLVIKPKTPFTLRARLGPVNELLKIAEATGRCFIYEEGGVQSSHPPVAAALASDLAIHTDVVAASAGLEMALSGIPTLLMDSGGWAKSPLYTLGLERVIFRDWMSLWNACNESWRSGGRESGLGDWSKILPYMDPFQDGRAAERMGTFLMWLLEGFKKNLTKEEILEYSVERYRESWGHDKIILLTDSFPYPNVI